MFLEESGYVGFRNFSFKVCFVAKLGNTGMVGMSPILDCCNSFEETEQLILQIDNFPRYVKFAVGFVCFNFTIVSEDVGG